MEKIIQNGICYELDIVKRTAKIIFSPNAKGDIIIPHSIKYGNHEYKIKTICEHSFKNNSDIRSISFPQDSELSVIEKYAFYFSSVEKISIPISIEKLEGGWNYKATKLTQISLSKYNKNYMFQNENFIVSKMNRKSRIYDVFNYLSNTISSITIPSSIKRIESHAFSNCDALEYIDFQENSELVTIGDYAFSETSIMEISIPSSVTEIQYGAFSFCKKLKSVIFPETSKLKVIEKAVFYNSSIKNIWIPSGVEIIEEETFCYCLDLENIKFSSDSKLKKIKTNSFSFCRINSFLIPANVDKIEENFCHSTNFLQSFQIFPENKNFIFSNQMLIGKSNPNSNEYDVILYIINYNNEITIPNNIKRIGDSCFHSTKINSIEFQSDSILNSIGTSCFYFTQIKKIVIPSSVEYIGRGAFYECKKLTSIQFSKNSKLKRIESSTFFNCSIEHISVPSSVEVIGKSAFFLCTSLQKVYFEDDSKLELIDDGAFHLSGLISIKIPSKVKRIGAKAFSNSPLRSIEISDDSDLESIGSECFESTPIKSIYIPYNFKKFDECWCKNLKLISFSVSPKNKLFITYKNDFLLGKSNQNENTFDVLITANHNLKDITIPSFIKYIDDCAFSLFNIVSVKFDENSQLKSINKYAFNNIKCMNIILPSSLEKIEENTFYQSVINNENIFSRNFNLNSIGDYSFYLSLINKILIPSSVKYLGKGAFKQSQLKNIKFDEDIKLDVIGENAFSETLIESIIIPSAIRIIGTNAFFSCSKLKSVEFQANSKLCSIGINAFHFTAIETITIPSKVKKIKSAAFSGCSKLKSIFFPNDSQLNSIDDFALSYINISNIQIPSNLTQLGKYSILNCQNLNTIEILSYKTLTIDYYCFSCLPKLTLVSFPNVQSISMSKDGFIGVNNHMILFIKSNTKIDFID